MPAYTTPTQAGDYSSLFNQLSGGGGMTPTMVNPDWGAAGIQKYLTETAQKRGEQQAALGGAQLANLQSQQTGATTQQALSGLGAGLYQPNIYMAPLFQYSGVTQGQQGAGQQFGNAPAQFNQTMTGQPVATTQYNAPRFTAPNPNAVAGTPEYQFALQQGQTAVDRSMGARGLSQSGNRLAALTEFGQGLASTQYQNVFQNALAGYGANASAQQAAAELNARQQQFGSTMNLQQQQLAAQERARQEQMQFDVGTRDIEAQRAAGALNLESQYRAAALTQQGEQAYNALLAELGIQKAGLLMQGTERQQAQQTEALGQQTYANMIQGLIQGLMPTRYAAPTNPQTGTWRMDQYNNSPQNLAAFGSFPNTTRGV